MRSLSVRASLAKKSVVLFVSMVGILGLAVQVVAASRAPTMPARVGYDADPYRQVNVTPQAAIDAVKRMLAVPQTPLVDHGVAAPVNTSDLVATGPFDGAVFRYYKVAGGGAQATVDVNDAHVAQLLFLSQLSASSCSTTITTAQAQVVASSFLASRSVATDGLPATVSKKNRGDIKSFEVTWQRIVDGAEVPYSRTVELDACTGLVFNMNSISRPYSVPPTPVVGHDQAVSMATGAVKSATRPSGSGAQPLVPYKLVDARLQVTFDATGAQQLLWSIQLGADIGNGYVQYYWVTVDSVTGSTAIVDVGM